MTTPTVPLWRKSIFHMRQASSIAKDAVAATRPNPDRDRVFCLSTGSCGSKYLVALLTANGLDGCYHEKFPDLDVRGVRHYLDGSESWGLRPTLRVTRERVNVESNCRLFAMAPLLSSTFPSAGFIHLYRDGRDQTNSAMNKSNWPAVMSSPRLRYASMLSGPPGASPFERACWYWRNHNERIADDLEGRRSIPLQYEDLISGNVGVLGDFLGRRLHIASIDPVNTKQHAKLTTKRFDSPADWPAEYHDAFARICGPTMRRLGYE